ncbi:MAG TPA: ABC transporter permease [Caulobacteraceae bacterium]
MLRNYIAAAFGNLGRNWLYAFITIGGLAISFAAAILIGLYLRDEYGFDRFIPGYQDIYRVELTILAPGQKPLHTDFVQAAVAGHLKLDFPEVADVARLSSSDGILKIGGNQAFEAVGWADPDFFRIMRLPVLAGDPDAAMRSPDGLVLTRELARKYFGQDAPLGKVIQVNPGLTGSSYHPMRVMAVLKDTPASSHLTAQIFAPARAAFSPTTSDDLHPTPYDPDQLTYVRLKGGSSPSDWAARFQAFDQAHYPAPGGGRSTSRYSLAPLKTLHFTSAGPSPLTRPPGDDRVDAGVAVIGALIVLIAGINFVTLMTARATRRSVEVGIRKAVGARRRDLVIQFMGECFIHVGAAMLLAIALAELLLPKLDGFVGRELNFHYLTDPGLAVALLSGAVITAALAGLYPSLVMSAFRPASALKGGTGQISGSKAVRQGLVVVQFAILAGLIVMTATIYRQIQFALHDALRLDMDQVVLADGPCGSAFNRAAAAVPGVKGVACTNLTALRPGGLSIAVMPDRSPRTIYVGQTDVGLFEIQGLRPVAGRFFSKDRGEDMLLDRPAPGADLQPSIVLNEAGARQLGYARPEDAVGKIVDWMRPPIGARPNAFPTPHPSRVIGIVPDFSLGSVRNAIPPTIFYVDPASSPVLVLKLDRNRVPEALDALRKLWRPTGQDGPPDIVFESQTVQGQYADMITQEIAIGICSALAILIACLGLFALAAFTAEQRTKEIGVRKAMGASTADIMGLLVWQFTKPVLWANLIAWPLAFWATDRWLHGFAYRVSLPAWLFLAASATAVLIAWATVATHAWMAARTAPATALRYE